MVDERALNTAKMGKTNRNVLKNAIFELFHAENENWQKGKNEEMGI